MKNAGFFVFSYLNVLKFCFECSKIDIVYIAER